MRRNRVNYLKFTKEEKKHLKEVNKKLNLMGRPEKNKYSLKEWKQFIQYDYDFGWECLFDMILFKMEKMYCYLSRHVVREMQEEDIVSLKEAIDLGWKIHDDEYDDKAHKFHEEHVTSIVYVYPNASEYEADKLLATLKYKRLPIDLLFDKYKSKEYKESYPDLLFGSDEAIDAWLKENPQYKKKDLTFTYSGEWDSEKNDEKWRKMLEAANKARTRDVNKFFRLIAQNRWEWND